MLNMDHDDGERLSYIRCVSFEVSYIRARVFFFFFDHRSDTEEFRSM